MPYWEAYSVNLELITIYISKSFQMKTESQYYGSEYNEQCQQCKNMQRKLSDSSSQHSSEDSESSQNLVIPLKKVSGNSRSYESSLTLMQTQIRHLQESNQHKDQMIQDLQQKLNSSQPHKFPHQTNLRDNKMMSMHETSHAQSQEMTGSFRNKAQERKDFIKDRKQFVQNNDNARITLGRPGNRVDSLDDVSEDLVQKISEKYLAKIRKHLENESQLKKLIKELEGKIVFFQEEMVWMTNFIASFLRMIDLISTRFNESIMYSSWTLKKKTKVAWRYLKHQLQYYLNLL